MAKIFTPDLLPSVDDLFTTQEQRDDDKREKIYDIPLNEIDAFPDHPFRVINDEAMTNMVESVRQYGIQTPALVRKKEDGRYELISGHRRKQASEHVGLTTLPCIIRIMSRDEAVIMMVDSNLQREKILPSEKGFSYKMKLEAIKRTTGRPLKNNGSPLENPFKGKKSAELIGEQTGESKDQIYRYIRLTELTPKLLEMVDQGKIAFRPAVELSYLPKEKQDNLFQTMEIDECTPSLAQAIKMKKFEQDGKLTEEVILSIMCEEKANQVEQFKMPKDKIKKYFPAGTSKIQIEDTIVKALEMYRKKERSRVTER